MAWDLYAIHAGHWTYDLHLMTGILLPGRLPLDEVLFFLVTPTCAILAFERGARGAQAAGRDEETGAAVSYTELAVLGVAGAVLVDTVVLRTWLLRRRTYWTAYAIVLFFQLITNGILTGFEIVRYDPAAILGWRIAFAPVEDLLFGYAMVTLTLSFWVWLGRRGIRT